jgi:hypothetical protein
MRSIPTRYAGIEYRSRLEARWAAFFDRIGWHYTYEPFDADGYIPDFAIHGDRPMLVEVKPAVVLADYATPAGKMRAAVDGHWTGDLLVLGVDPLPHWGYRDHEHPVAGLLGQYGLVPHPGGDVTEGHGWYFSEGLWNTCLGCGQVGIVHSTQSFADRPCGHYEGGCAHAPMTGDVIRRHWAAACNEVKWGPS